MESLASASDICASRSLSSRSESRWSSKVWFNSMLFRRSSMVMISPC